MNVNKVNFIWVAMGLLFTTTALAQPRLYPTGPSEDAAFIRFVTSTGQPITISTGSGGQLKLTAQQPSSDWLQVTPNTKLEATISQDNQQKMVAVEAKPSEFITIAAVPDNATTWTIETGHEAPQDFDAFKVSLGLLNLAPACKTTSIKLADKETSIISGVELHDTKRRLVNPVAFSVDLYCNDQKIGKPLALDHLRAGDRWTLLVYPSKNEPMILPILDKMP